MNCCGIRLSARLDFIILNSEAGDYLKQFRREWHCGSSPLTAAVNNTIIRKKADNAGKRVKFNEKKY